jgi:SpoVK/Ycf46/Vps4 family AAA+-type ATPase
MRESAAPNGNRDAAIDAAVGLSGEEAAACFAKSLVQTRKIDPAAVAKEKKRVIGKDKLLEWFDPLPGGLEAVGGLDNLKSWLVTRRSAYTRQAREYGLPAPKGCLLVGVPGCGKSLSAKAIATSWQVPLLRLDLGALKSKYVGESEGNLRKAFQVIESVGRCVVWLDEIEKALAGAVQGGADGGVSSDALGTILSWMQDRTGEAFVVATSNDISKLPPELMRKGRFDELFFVDLPNAQERAEIMAAALRQHKREPIMDLTAAVAATDTFTGSEIAALVPDAMFAAFNDGMRAITADDIVTAAQTVTPLAVTAADRIGNLRRLVAGKARPATSPTTTQESKSTRTLDF